MAAMQGPYQETGSSASFPVQLKLRVAGVTLTLTPSDHATAGMIGMRSMH